MQSHVQQMMCVKGVCREKKIVLSIFYVVVKSF